MSFTKAQLDHNKTIEGGFIGSLLAGAASAIIPSLISFISDKISGKGIYLKRGDGLIKVKHTGDGLYLKPYNGLRHETSTGDGLYFKNGSSYELVKDGSISDIPILNKL